MVLTTTRITGRLPLPDDSVWTGSFVEFTLRAVDIDGTEIVMPRPVAAPLDAEGQIDVRLWPNTSGGRGTSYTVTAHLMSPLTRRTASLPLGIAVVPQVLGTVDLAEMLTLDARIPDLPDALAQALAAASRAKSYADGMTNEAERAEAAALSAAASEEKADESSRSAAASAQEAKDIAGSVGVVIATQPVAEAGEDNSQLMTSLRTFQSFGKNFRDRAATAAQVIAGVASDLYVTPASLPAWLSSRLATRAEAEAGTNAEKLITPQKVAQYVTRWFAGRIASLAQAMEGLSADTIMTPATTRRVIDLRSLGHGGQTRQDVSAERQVRVIYQNTTGRAIFVNIYTSFGNVNFETSMDQQTWMILYGQNINNDNRNFISTIVLPGEYYRVMGGGIGYWQEIR